MRTLRGALLFSCGKAHQGCIWPNPQRPTKGTLEQTDGTRLRHDLSSLHQLPGVLLQETRGTWGMAVVSVPVLGTRFGLVPSEPDV